MSLLLWYLCKIFLSRLFWDVVLAVDGPIKEPDLIVWVLLYVCQKPVLPTLITQLIYNTLFPKFFDSFPQEANCTSIYKDWFLGKSRQESPVSSEGRLKEKCLILSRESLAVVQTLGMKLISSAVCEKNPHYHILVPLVGRWSYNFSFVVAYSLCICQKNNHLGIPDRRVVKTLCFHCRGRGFDPPWRN